MSGISPSRFGESMPCKRTGATAAITAGVGCGSGLTGGAEVVLYSAVIVLTSGETGGVCIDSNSVAEITPLSRKSAARRSRCSAGDAFVVIARASASVRIPFACSTRTRGSLVSVVCEKTTSALPKLTITIKVRRRYTRMIRSFLPQKGTKDTKEIKNYPCAFCAFLWLPLFLSFLSFVVLASVAAGEAAIPAGMVRPGPTLGYGAIHHRTERARLMGRAFVNVNDETGQHQQRGQIVNHKTHRHHPPRRHIVKPHQQPGDQKQNGAQSNQPEVKLLSGVEKPDVLRFDPFFIRGVLANPSHPASIGFDPRHRRKPVDELK